MSFSSEFGCTEDAQGESGMIPVAKQADVDSKLAFGMQDRRWFS
jgi:hypothetical protein